MAVTESGSTARTDHGEARPDSHASEPDAHKAGATSRASKTASRVSRAASRGSRAGSRGPRSKRTVRLASRRPLGAARLLGPLVVLVVWQIDPHAASASAPPSTSAVLR